MSNTTHLIQGGHPQEDIILRWALISYSSFLTGRLLTRGHLMKTLRYVVLTRKNALLLHVSDGHLQGTKIQYVEVT